MYAFLFSCAGNVYVSDKGNNRIQKFDLSGNFLAAWGSQGGGNGQFQSQEGLCLDRLGNIYVADWINHRMQKFSYATLEVEGGASAGLTLAPLANPTREDLRVRFTLPTRAPGRIELIDLQGRRAAFGELGAMEPGVHQFEFERGSLPAGLYFVRLEHGGQSRVTRVALLR